MNRFLVRVAMAASAVVITVGMLTGIGLNTSAPARAAPVTAPNFAGITHWINSKPLTMKGLRGKVVLIDFWAYSCINCLRTFPYLTHWYQEYHKDGLVIVGVHSPEFTFGKHLANVKRAVKHFGITYPVAMDSHLDTWNAWHNQYWPAEYLVNKQGQVVLHHYGEGRYLAMENAIRHELGLAPKTGMNVKAPHPDFADIGSPEMYFGSAREQFMANDHGTSATPYVYHQPDTLALNQFALGGTWSMTGQYAQLHSGSGTIALHFSAAKLHMVASSDQPITLQIKVDGKAQPPVTVHASKLYTLFSSPTYGEHSVTITIPKPGLRAYTFTFG